MSKPDLRPCDDYRQYRHAGRLTALWAVESAMGELGPVDILINAAGTSGRVAMAQKWVP